MRTFSSTVKRRLKLSSRTEVAALLLLCFGLASSFKMLRGAQKEVADGAVGHDEVTTFGVRLEAIRHDLPRDGVVGYVADPPLDIETNRDYARELVLVRYYLVPLVVLPYSQQSLAVGNFHKPPPARLLSDWHLVLRKDYGNGVMLFVKQE